MPGAPAARGANPPPWVGVRAFWPLVGGCPLFRTYAVPDAVAAQDRLAQAHVWSRVFPYSATWLRLGLPGSDEWPMVEAALR